MCEIRFGPSGIGGKQEALSTLEKYYEAGLKACEIAFTYGVYLDKESAEQIGKLAKKLDISLSIHAPYYVNLNSSDKKKLLSTRKRILDCCKIGHYLSLGDSTRKTKIVFHPGYYGEDRKLAFEKIYQEVKDLFKDVKENNWNVILCPEVMGKINVFGSIEEISNLVKDTGCSCCIDFAHIIARYQGDKKYKEVKEAFSNLSEWHCHFSGIIYTDKGEKQHKSLELSEWKNLISFIKTLDKKEVVIICESPNPFLDSIRGLKTYEEMF